MVPTRQVFNATIDTMCMSSRTTRTGQGPGNPTGRGWGWPSRTKDSLGLNVELRAIP